MRAGDLVRVDFGVPVGSEPGFPRPAVVVTADAVLAHTPRTFHVVPVTSNVRRSLPTEVVVTASGLDGPSVAQCHLCAVIGVERILDQEYGNIGPAELAQIRAVLGDLLDIG
ncbi:MAG: type II toxin-antitoxin system PemK/MazF family toxin [Acidimicrobiales bacterium]